MKILVKAVIALSVTAVSVVCFKKLLNRKHKAYTKELSGLYERAMTEQDALSSQGLTDDEMFNSQLDIANKLGQDAESLRSKYSIH